MDVAPLLSTILNYKRGSHVHCEGSLNKAKIGSSSFEGNLLKGTTFRLQPRNS